MHITAPLARATLTVALAFTLLAALAACKPQPPQTPPPPTTEVVTPNVIQPAATDRPDAPHAIGTVAAGQAGSGANRGPAESTAGDGAASAAASAASR